MTDERFSQLMRDESQSLTKAEIAEGWHFCWDFDGLLRNNKEDEGYQCDCFTGPVGPKANP